MKIAKVVITALLIIASIVVIWSSSSKEIVDKERNQIGIVLGVQFDVNDVRNIAKEVLGKGNYIVKKATVFEDVVIIQSEGFSKENVKSIVEKINAKYGLEIKAEDVEVEKIGAENLNSDLTKYALPAVIALVLISVYFGFRFKKIGWLRTIVRFVTTVLFAELLYISVLAISQVEIGMLAAPIGVALFALATLASVLVFEKEREEFILNESK